MCRVVTESGADFIKTSTGFSTAGATPEDVALMRKYSGPQVKVKAAGGIASIEDEMCIRDRRDPVSGVPGCSCCIDDRHDRKDGEGSGWKS